MATISERKNKHGHVTSYRVTWYEDGVRQKPYATKSRDQAYLWKRLVEQYKTEALARKALARELSDTPRFSVVAEKHLSRLINVSPYQLHRYQRYLVNHLDDHFSAVPVDEITVDDIIGWVRYMQDKGLAPKTIANVHGLLHSIMDTAVELGHVQRNPCQGRYLPKNDKTEDDHVILTREELDLLLRHIDEHFHPLVWFLYATGLRASEACALIPEDFDLDGPTPTVRITKARKNKGKGGWYIGPPKSPRARRTVSMPRDIAEMLRPLVEAAAFGEDVFKMKAGGVATVDALHSRVWQKSVTAARKAGLRKRPGLHALRHSHASLCLAHGMDMFTLSRRLGHEDVGTTMNVYSHLMPDVHVKSNEVVSRAIGAIAGPAGGDVVDEGG